MRDTVYDSVREAYMQGVHRITCPKCLGGGNREYLTMTLLLDSPDIIGKCWRATCGAIIRERLAPGDAQNIPAAPEFSPRHLTAAYRMPEPGDAWYTKLVDAGGDVDTARLRVLVDTPDTAVWVCKDVNGRHLGHVTRDLNKTIRTYKAVPESIYFANSICWQQDCRWVFEDPMSATLCAERAIALLGTYMSRDMAKHLRDAESRCSFFVALDPGAEDAAMKVIKTLLNAGLSATFVPMNEDFKDMNPGAREMLLESYS